MARIAPFRALRFSDSELSDVVAPPYDVIGPEDFKKYASRSDHNIVHVDLPVGEGDAKYAHAATLLAAWQKSGALTRDEKPSILAYEQTFLPPGGGAPITRKGFFALVAAEPYEARVVLPHERTLSGPKEDRYRLFCATKTALSPVFLLYQDPAHTVANTLAAHAYTNEFTTDDGIKHRFARVTDAKSIHAVAEALRTTQLLIADGHHRYETTLRYGASIDAERAERGEAAAPNGGHKYVLAFLADADDKGLVVFPTHRLVHSLQNFSRESFLEKAAELFHVTPVNAENAGAFADALATSGKNAPSLGIVFKDGSGAMLSLRSDVNVDTHPALKARPEVLRRMDVVLLHSGLLEAVLGMTLEEQAKQTNIAYYKVATDAVRDIKAGKGDFLVLMNGTPVSDVRKSCEVGEVMPQKSTFFYPKVPTGLVMHVLDPNDAIENA